MNSKVKARIGQFCTKDDGSTYSVFESKSSLHEDSLRPDQISESDLYQTPAERLSYLGRTNVNTHEGIFTNKLSSSVGAGYKCYNRTQSFDEDDVTDEDRESAKKCPSSLDLLKKTQSYEQFKVDTSKSYVTYKEVDPNNKTPFAVCCYDKQTKNIITELKDCDCMNRLWHTLSDKYDEHDETDTQYCKYCCFDEYLDQGAPNAAQCTKWKKYSPVTNSKDSSQKASKKKSCK